MADDLARQLREKLAVRRGDTLAEKLPRARTLLPKSVRQAAQLVAAAAERSAHPKLHKQVDLPAVRAAHKLVAQHLAGIDPKARRVDAALGIAANLTVNLALLAIGLVAVTRLLPI